MKKLAFLILLIATCPQTSHAADAITIVAAENFYGDVAQQIGGPAVAVKSILSNPDQDPHLFEASPSVARAISAARIAVYNGIDYDPWMEKLLAAAANPDRTVIVVAELAGKKAGDNPHIWYDPQTMLAYATALAKDLGVIDPAHQAGYQQNLATFTASLQPITAKIATLHTRLAGRPVTATEPVFGYMFAALGLDVRNQPFQLAVMNNTEPAAAAVAAFETDLKQHRVQLLVYNSQAADPIAKHMENLAKAAHVPVVGATETEPAGTHYQDWLLNELDAVDHALPN
jgi:zinc/manganese transport system substrate-binding protein